LRQVHRAKLPDDVSEIKLVLKIDFDEIGDYQPRWNAAPTSNLPVVTCILTLMRWGLIPSWAKDLKIGYSTFNARAETPTKRAAFRGAWRPDCAVSSSPTAITNGEMPTSSRSRSRWPIARPDDARWTMERLRSPAGEGIKSFACTIACRSSFLWTVGPIGLAKTLRPKPVAALFGPGHGVLGG